MMGVVSVAVMTFGLMLTTQLSEAVLLRLVTLSWKRQHCGDDDDSGVSRHHHHHHHHYHHQQQQQQCSDDWRSTYAQFDDVNETCFAQQRDVILFDLSSGFSETNV